MKGFTLLETLVVVGIIGIITLMHAMFVTGARLRLQEIERGRDLIWNELVRARDDADLSSSGTDWGVAIFPNSATRFSGSSYASRNTALDVITTVPDFVTISGPSEIIFLRPDGRTSDNYIVTITADSRVFTITISPQGLITIQ